MEEKESKKHVKYTPDPVEHQLDPITLEEVFRQFVVEVVEEQDRVIMRNIDHIAGKRYEHITIDRDKTLEALNNATAKPVVVEDYNGEYKVKKCPTCGKWLAIVSKRKGDINYCRNCGQKLDWSEVK